YTGRSGEPSSLPSITTNRVSVKATGVASALVRRTSVWRTMLPVRRSEVAGCIRGACSELARLGCVPRGFSLACTKRTGWRWDTFLGVLSSGVGVAVEARPLPILGERMAIMGARFATLSNAISLGAFEMHRTQATANPATSDTAGL